MHLDNVPAPVNQGIIPGLQFQKTDANGIQRYNWILPVNYISPAQNFANVAEILPKDPIVLDGYNYMNITIPFDYTIRFEFYYLQFNLLTLLYKGLFGHNFLSHHADLICVVRPFLRVLGSLFQLLIADLKVNSLRKQDKRHKSLDLAHI